MEASVQERSTSAGLRMGVDLVDIDQMTDSLRFGDRFLQRFFTPGELVFSRRAGAPCPRRLSACFAAKEAAFKVLGAPGGIAWTCVEVVPTADARPNPALRLWREALDRARELGLVSLQLSLSYQSRLAVALVVGELGETPLHS
jgi:holo-[acyl-carrier protein] synthase